MSLFIGGTLVFAMMQSDSRQKPECAVVAFGTDMGNYYRGQVKPIVVFGARITPKKVRVFGVENSFVIFPAGFSLVTCFRADLAEALGVSGPVWRFETADRAESSR